MGEVFEGKSVLRDNNSYQQIGLYSSFILSKHSNMKVTKIITHHLRRQFHFKQNNFKSIGIFQYNLDNQFHKKDLNLEKIKPNSFEF